MNGEPYTTLMRFRQWSTNDLYLVLCNCLHGVPEPERTIILRVLDHIQVVEDIFRHHLQRRPHGHQAPRSQTIPSFETMQVASREMGAWYADYTARLTQAELEAPIEFAYANGEPARLTRGEMLLHVAMHGAGHRGNIGILLQKNGLQPSPDRLTDFLRAERAQCGGNVVRG